MSREVKKYKFNKNHIEIFTIENPEIPIPKWPAFEEVSANSYSYSHNFGWQQKEEYKTVKKESKLGFYYYSKVRVHQPGKTFSGSISRTIVTFPMPGEKNMYYQLKYVTQYDDNKIGGEDGLRPWDIYPGDKNFPDNMLEGLIKDVNDFFNIAETCVSSFYKNQPGPNYKTISFKEVKNKVFTELFGNPNGPRFQTNMEKILAHGFDPKYSFRKDKEKK